MTKSNEWKPRRIYTSRTNEKSYVLFDWMGSFSMGWERRRKRHAEDLECRAARSRKSSGASPTIGLNSKRQKGDVAPTPCERPNTFVSKRCYLFGCHHIWSDDGCKLFFENKNTCWLKEKSIILAKTLVFFCIK